MKRVYVAGKMSGEPNLNYHNFNRVAKQLRAEGYHVENPAENPDPPCKSWRKYMEMAIRQLATCDAIFLLNGWQDSKGAGVEYELALGLGMEIIFENPDPSLELVAYKWVKLDKLFEKSYEY